jgi:hypothetical protein
MWIYTSTPPYNFMARDNFTFYKQKQCTLQRNLQCIFFRDGKSEDEDEDEDYDGCNGDSGDFPSLENSGKTSPSSGEYYIIVAVNMSAWELACSYIRILSSR